MELSARQHEAGARLPEEKLAVQIRHVDAVEVNHVNISEARERQVLQDHTSCENVSYHTHRQARPVGSAICVGPRRVAQGTHQDLQHRRLELESSHAAVEQSVTHAGWREKVITSVTPALMLPYHIARHKIWAGHGAGTSSQLVQVLPALIVVQHRHWRTFIAYTQSMLKVRSAA